MVGRIQCDIIIKVREVLARKGIGPSILALALLYQIRERTILRRLLPILTFVVLGPTTSQTTFSGDRPSSYTQIPFDTFPISVLL